MKAKKKNTWLDDLDQILAGGVEGQVEHEAGRIVDTNCLGRVVLKMLDDDREEENLLKGKKTNASCFCLTGNGRRARRRKVDGDEEEEEEEEEDEEEEPPSLRAAIRETLIPIGVLSSGR